MDAAWGMAVAWELGLFAGAVGLLLALDDLAVDAFWFGRVGRRPEPLSGVRTPKPLTYAVMVPAWREAAVIVAMLTTLRTRWGDGRYRVYVGVYPNDVATMAAVARLAANAGWLQLVIVDHDGPTSKGDCLNAIWRRVQADGHARRFAADAVIIHDAEDVVAEEELAAHDAALVDHGYAQLPVVPIVDRAGPLVSGHYCDEFAEGHLKELAVREALGAQLPLAGVGCAIRVTDLARIDRGGGPFSEALTEDYELGLRLTAAGASGRLALFRGADGALVATRALFPHRFADAVRQKTRWMRGIAFDGWLRLGWPLRPGSDELEHVASWWMLWRDRRTALSALALISGYGALAIVSIVALLHPAALATHAADPLFAPLAGLMTLLLLWRLAMRCMFTARVHGWAQGLWAVPRLFVSNVILVACAWRALTGHVAGLQGRPVRWDKTRHAFPDLAQLPLPRR